jgi:hypothetical protein
MDAIPPLSVDLIAELDVLYPPITAKEVLLKSSEEIRQRAGARAVVEYLLQKLELEKEEDLNV